MANSLMSILGNISGNSNMLLQAFGAMMRGESPQDFMRTLAQTRPELRGLDLTDINGSAEKLCRQRGVDPGKLAEEIKMQLPSGRG